MSVPPIQMAALDWVAAAAGTMARPLPVGEIVSGRVLQRLDDFRLVLQIAGLTVEADPPSNGPIPQHFQARVLSGGQQPVLELLAQPDQAAPTSAALRARLPRQGGLQPLLADLHAISGAPGVRNLPEPVRVALARLEASVTDRHDVLDPDVLRDTVRRAGTQLEHTLLQQSRSPVRLPAPQIDYDFKAGLERLAQALQQLPNATPQRAPPAPALPLPTPAEPVPMGTGMPAAQAPQAPQAPPVPARAETAPPLQRLPLQPQARVPAPPAAEALVLAAGMSPKVDAALARIEIMQLEAHASVAPQACMVEVPVRGDDGFDVLQLRIERDGEGGPAGGAEPAAPHWTLGFSLDPPSLGAIEGQIRLRGTAVDVDLWARRDEAVQALEEQTTVLGPLLEASGLRLGQLRVRHGTPQRHTGFGRRLLEASA